MRIIVSSVVWMILSRVVDSVYSSRREFELYDAIVVHGLDPGSRYVLTPSLIFGDRVYVCEEVVFTAPSTGSAIVKMCNRARGITYGARVSVVYELVKS